MMNRVPSPQDPVRRAAWKIGLRVGLASLLVLFIVLIAALVFLIRRAQPAERAQRIDLPGYLLIDGREIYLAAALAALVLVLALTAFAVYTARKAVRPLQDAIEQQRRFVQDASHQLRTPLAVIDARAQLLARLDADGQRAVELQSLRGDIRRMVSTVENLLQGTAPVEPTEAVDFDAVIQSLSDELQVLAREKKVQLSFEPGARVRVASTETALRTVLLSVLENALKVTPAGGRVALISTVDVGSAVLRITDTGPGITAETADQIFQREFSASGNGFGLGLAIAAETAEQYRGSLTLESSSSAGSTFSVKIPLSKG
ncbi:signal transduction histidine kinase [Psychromicrobium silvestre]|uniref:histidine kinase n=1 Tax=Psychromicrobium silvestre TaxID=1645614 RepID=A0A7Y9S922_9MICC|nr:HAMP domain-containing sensor histidine kinase [Psychromicrobium silvestre]NYE95917.1 signal transduction histidine kinase [Psychromicrobium silvestre]